MSKRTFYCKGVPFSPNVISDEAYDEMMRQRQQAERADMIERYRNACFSDKTLRRCTFEADDRAHSELTRIARDYVQNFDDNLKNGRGLLFYGTVGTGKTFISACIANALVNQGYSCKMTTFTRIYNDLLATFEKQACIDKLKRYDLLIIDDLAAEGNTEYMRSAVFDVIDNRYRSGKPIIVTTNLTGDELIQPSDIYQSRVYSRIFEMCLPYRVIGDDRRKAKLKAILEQR